MLRSLAYRIRSHVVRVAVRGISKVPSECFVTSQLHSTYDSTKLRRQGDLEARRTEPGWCSWGGAVSPFPITSGLGDRCKLPQNFVSESRISVANNYFDGSVPLPLWQYCAVSKRMFLCAAWQYWVRRIWCWNVMLAVVQSTLPSQSRARVAIRN